LIEPPSAVGPKWCSEDEDPNVFSFSCIGCFNPIKSLRFNCENCCWPACSPDCSGLSNSELHGIECGFLKLGNGPQDRTNVKSIKAYFRSDILLALKILILQRKNPKKFRNLMAMESNETNRLETFNFCEAEDRINFIETNFLNPLKAMEAKSGQKLLPENDRKILHKIFGILESNSHYISLSTDAEICGVYPLASLMEHSCVPNCSFRFDMKNGFKIIVEAARDIKPGEHLKTTYTKILCCTMYRQQHLKDSKYFVCTCERCKDPKELGTNFSTLRCMGTDEMPCNGFQLPVDPISADCEWACEKCPIRVSNEDVSFLLEKINEEIEQILASEPSAKVLEDLLEKLERFLHPTHFHMFTLKHALVQIYGTHKDSPVEKLSEEILMRKLKLCDELLRAAETLDPFSIRISIYTGILYWEKFNALKELQKRNFDGLNNKTEAINCLKRAEKVMRNELDSKQGKDLNRKISQAMNEMQMI
jgi:hypothetical protein